MRQADPEGSAFLNFLTEGRARDLLLRGDFARPRAQPGGGRGAKAHAGGSLQQHAPADAAVLDTIGNDGLSASWLDLLVLRRHSLKRSYTRSRGTVNVRVWLKTRTFPS